MTDNDALDSDGEDGGLAIFEEPEGFRQPEKQPTTVTHTTVAGQELTLRLLGHSPLWGHLLWQAGKTISNYLETQASTLIHNKTVLELGAGAGLPSIVCALNGAKFVLATDYPDPDLIENLQHNVSANCSSQQIAATGYLWGADVSALKSNLPLTGTDRGKENEGFDLLILADLLFNHSEHGKLLDTVHCTLSTTTPDSQALVFFTPYRPWLLEQDLAFFDLARQAGLHVEKILETKMEKVMFEEDRGDEKLRRTVFGYRLTWPR